MLILLLSISTARGATYYVSTTGSDSADGSVVTPWLTLDHALTVVTAGNTIQIQDGTYPSNATTRAHGPLTIQGSSTPASVVVGRITLAHSNITVTGVHVLSNYIAVDGLSASHNTVSNCLFTGGTQGVYFFRDSGDSTGTNGTSFNRIVSCTFSNMTGDGAVAVFGVSNLISRNVFAWMNGWDVIRLWGVGTTVSDNVFSNNISGTEAGHGNHGDIFQTFTSSSGIEAKGIVIERNLFLDNSCTLGMLQSDTNTTTHQNWTVRNNVFWNSRMQCEIWIPDFTVYNNTVFSNTSSLGFRFAVETPGRNADSGKVKNNIFSRCVGTYSFHAGLTNCESDYNLLTSTNDTALTLPDEGVHSINGGYTPDQIFRNYLTHDAVQEAGSPSINAGVVIAGFSDDYTSAARISPWDIGAYELIHPIASAGTVTVGTLTIGP